MADKAELIHAAMAGCANEIDIFVAAVCHDEVYYLNNAAQSIIGDDVCGKPLGAVTDAELLFQAQRGYYTVYNGRYLKLSSFPGIDTADGVITLYIGADITEMKESEEKLRKGMSLDFMTNIYNRQAGLDFLEMHQRRFKENGEIFSVCYIDLNDLKYVNDNRGHIAGDDFIHTVVSITKDSIRATDIFARLGGDEFLLILPGCRYDTVNDIMMVIESKLAQDNDSGRHSSLYSIAYGITEVSSVMSEDDILNIVDSKMYYMKEQYKRSRGVAAVSK